MEAAETVKGPPPSRARRWIKLGILVAIVAGAFVLFRFTPLREYASAEKVKPLIEGVRGAVWAPPVVVLSYAALTLVGFSGLIMTVLVGATYGLLWGTALVVIASNLGAWGAFLIARYLGREWIESRLQEGSKLRALDESLREKGLLRVIQVRLIPLLPFNMLNFACGLTSVRFRDYALGSFLGMLPGTFVFVYSSAALMRLWLEGKTEDRGLLIFNVVLSLSLLAIVSLIPAVYRKPRGKRELPVL